MHRCVGRGGIGPLCSGSQAIHPQGCGGVGSDFVRGCGGGGRSDCSVGQDSGPCSRLAEVDGLGLRADGVVRDVGLAGTGLVWTGRSSGCRQGPWREPPVFSLRSERTLQAGVPAAGASAGYGRSAKKRDGGAAVSPALQDSHGAVTTTLGTTRSEGGTLLELEVVLGG